MGCFASPDACAKTAAATTNETAKARADFDLIGPSFVTAPRGNLSERTAGETSRSDDEDANVVDVQAHAGRAGRKAGRGKVEDDTVRVEDPAAAGFAKTDPAEPFGDGGRHVADEIEIVERTIRI